MLILVMIEIERPRKTDIALAATTFPMELSAVESLTEAILVAKTSMREVPKVTRVIAVTSSFSPIRQPRILARSLLKGSSELLV